MRIKLGPKMWKDLGLPETYNVVKAGFYLGMSCDEIINLLRRDVASEMDNVIEVAANLGCNDDDVIEFHPNLRP